jgi:Lon protease-like protein
MATSTAHREIPLFPLRTVLFTGGRLPLRIFEPRYMDMVSHCMREQTGFGVVLIRDGKEARTDPDDDQPRIFNIGTYASIIDFNQLAGGLLGILTQGGEKFRVLASYERPNHLMMGEVEMLPDEQMFGIATEYQPLVEILRDLMEHPMVRRLNFDVDYGDARAVSWRLAELLPVEPEIKQSLLQMNHPRERLAELRRLIERMRN